MLKLETGLRYQEIENVLFNNNPELNTLSLSVMEEDENDYVYKAHISGTHVQFNQVGLSLVAPYLSSDYFVSVTHFWDADNGYNSLTSLSGEKMGIDFSFSCPSAYTKMKRYENGYQNGYEQYVFPYSETFPNINCEYPYPHYNTSRRFVAPSSLLDFSNTGRTRLYEFITLAYENNVPNCADIIANSIGGTEHFFKPEYRFRKWLILGRMTHLLQDMSVPAHAHNDEHSPTLSDHSNCDNYEGWGEGSNEGYLSSGNCYNYNYRDIYNNGGRLINIQNSSDPVKYAAYTMNQLADYFGSDDVNGDTNLIEANSFVSNHYNLWNNSYSINNPVRTSGEKTNDQCKIIADNLIPLSIQMTAGFLKWYIDSTNISSIDNSIYVSGTISVPNMSNYDTVQLKLYNQSSEYVFSCNANGTYNFKLPIDEVTYGNYSLLIDIPLHYPVIKTIYVQQNQLNITIPTITTTQISNTSIKVNTDPAVSAFRTIQDAINYVQIQCSPTEQKTFNVIVQNNTTWNENVVIGNLTNANLNIRGFGSILNPSSIYTNVNTSGGIPFDIDLNENCNIRFKGFSIQNNQLGVLIRSSNENCTFFVEDCKFLNNTNTFWTRDFAGSAIHSQFPIDVTDCVFSNNQAQWAPEYSSNNSGFGSAIYMIAKSGTVNITNNQFLQNSGKTSAVYVAGTSTEKNAIINMTGNTFKENRLIKSQDNIHNPDDFVSITVQYANTLNFEKNLIAKEKNDNNSYFSSAFISLTNLKIINNTFTENNVRAFGIYGGTGSNSKLYNNILFRNVCSSSEQSICTVSNTTITSANNYGFENKYSGSTNITTLPAGFTNIDPIIYLSTEGANAFHPKWTTSEISPCIDKGNPDTNDNGVVWYLDTDDQDSDGSRKDIGALSAVFHKNDRFSYRPLGLKNNINWISLPALNMLTANKNKFNNVFSEATTLNFQRFWSENNGSPDHNVINTGFSIFNPYYVIQRNLGYKLTLSSSMTIEISGDKLPDNTRVYLQENQSGLTQYLDYNWVGYFVDKPMTPWQAFAPVLDNIDEIKHKNWSTVKNPDGTWTNQNTPTWLISYGDMVMVHCIKECDLILGNNNQYPQYSAPRQTAQSFDYMEKDDYIPLYVDLNTESKSMPSEIGFYVNGICKGAAVVDNNVVEINAYVLDDSTDYSTAEISFVLHNDSKSAPKEVKIYSLYNSNEKKYVNQSLDMNDHQRYYTVKLNDIPEVQYETTLQGNYPNPFNPSTTIRFSLKNDSKVELSVYNVKGQKVRSLTQSMLEKGNHNIVWNGKDQNGQSCSSGVYFYKLKIDNKVLTRKMLMVK